MYTTIIPYQEPKEQKQLRLQQEVFYAIPNRLWREHIVNGDHEIAERVKWNIENLLFLRQNEKISPEFYKKLENLVASEIIRRVSLIVDEEGWVHGQTYSNNARVLPSGEIELIEYDKDPDGL